MAIQYPGNIISATERSTTSSSASGMWSLPAHIQKQKAGTWPATTPAIQTDTYFNLNTLLLHGDGTNGANNTVFVDSSTNAFTISNVGKQYQGTFSPFSQTGWSNYFNGSSDFLSIADNAAFDLAASDFTIEAWIQPLALPTSGNISVFFAQYDVGQATTNRAYLFSLYNNSGTMQLLMQPVSGSTETGITGNFAFAVGSWYHVAAVRSSNNIYLFVNGTQVGSTTAYSSTINNSTTTPSIGARLNGGAWQLGFSGYISNLRLVKDTALYTSNFTPSTIPLTAISNTQLLTCQSNYFKDNSTNAFTVTPSSTPSVQPFSPFAPSAAHSNTTVGGSILNTSLTTYLTASYNAAFDLGSSWTIDFWHYPLDTVGAKILSTRGASGAGWEILYSVSSKRYGIEIFNPSTGAISGTANSQLNSWNHVAVTYDGTNAKVYLNGTLDLTYSVSSTWSAGSHTLAIGGSTQYNEGVNGYLSDVRIVKGSIVYSGNFTPPTAPVSAIANTVLLLKGTNAGIIDHTAKNVITTSAGASVSTTQSKFGGSSISFNGTNGYLQLLNTRFNNIPASTDFTLECWVYTPASSTAPTVWHNTSSSKIVAFYLGSSDANNLDTIMGTFSYPSPNVSVVRGTIDVVANTWTHIAFVRSGSTITVYVGGTACGTGTSSYASNPLQLIGAISTGATTPDFYFFPGYIDDLRLTIGVARYSSNFTPSTTAFADR